MNLKRIFTGCLVLISLLQLQAITAQVNNITNPSEIMLSIGGDPTSEYSVTWRTPEGDTKTVAQIAKATANPNFKKSIKEVRGTFTENYGNRGNRVSHEVRFTNLAPNTLYSYRVGNGDEWSEWFQFTTAKKESDAFSFIYFGDIQNDIKSLGSRILRQAYTHLGNEAKFMLFVGDLVTKSTDNNWGEFFYAGDWILGSLPSVPTAGNHEYTRANNDKGYLFSTHWSKIYSMPQNPPLPEYQDRSYYFDYQGIRFISLDSYTLKKENRNLPTIINWLETTLENNPHEWSIVFTHYPIYSCSSGRDSEEYRDILRPVLEAHGVDLVLQGHDHTYCRGFNKKNIKGDVKNPPMYVVSVAGPKMYKLDEHPWSEVREQDTQLYQNITVDGNTLFYDSYDVTGNLVDSFRLEKSKSGVNTLIEQNVVR